MLSFPDVLGYSLFTWYMVATQSVIAMATDFAIEVQKVCTIAGVNSAAFEVFYWNVHISILSWYNHYGTHYFYDELLRSLFRLEFSARWIIPPSSTTMGQPHTVMCTTLSQVCQTSGCEHSKRYQPNRYILSHPATVKSEHTSISTPGKLVDFGRWRNVKLGKRSQFEGLGVIHN